jgi:hypothetical protein
MADTEFLSAITWHLECMALAMDAIESYHPPTDGFHVRMHHSLYVTNLMSLIDMLEEAHGAPFDEALAEGLKTDNFSGAQILGYVRELRNGIVHRGINPTSGGEEVDGIVCAISPPQVKNRRGTETFPAPFKLLRDLFRHLETHAKPVLAKFLSTTIDNLKSREPHLLQSDAVSAMEEATHMPDWAKDMARESITMEMMVVVRDSNISKVVDLLQPRANIAND